MSEIREHLNALKSDRRTMIDRMVASGDQVANIKGLATLQLSIAAFEAVIAEEDRALIEAACREFSQNFWFDRSSRT